MKTNFKPLGLAAAVAAASAGYAGIANAHAELADLGLGDMAIVPYYTVQGDFVTGVHITNTSNDTQVVKLRLRRATDSMDALDFNLIMSPKDVWTGFISSDSEGVITFKTNDNTCTAPERAGVFEMPGIYRNGADTGYIEVIGMGSPYDPNDATASTAIGDAAEHDNDGVPADCTAVASNFFAGGVAGSTKGVVNSVETVQATATGFVSNFYRDTGNVLKVSYFIRDGAAGLEFGNSAVHFEHFMSGATITNQETGIFSADLQGYDFPDLNGGAPLSALLGVSGAAGRGKFEDLRDEIGGNNIINDWSANQNEAGFTVGTDWVITLPGQYTMLNLGMYLNSLIDPTVVCSGANGCDNRDIPLTATFVVYDREEQGIVIEGGDLVVSPSLPGSPDVTTLDSEVNVVEWGVAPVLDAPNPITVSTPDGSVNGWANLAVVSDTTKTQAVCDFTLDPNNPIVCDTVDNAQDVPIVGFVAWERSFAANPDANYGRIVDHSYTASVSAP